ncbi:Iron-sulfur cluster assembly enzyme ISCU, mitochondrial [Dirofilaria immitis]|nr:Iron-sulfur cluster assembly enzyme ISCU, mitochondrial [Dirofilaria immitis]
MRRHMRRMIYEESHRCDYNKEKFGTIKKQRQQSTSANAGYKGDGREHGDDATSSEDGSTLESITSSTTLSGTSNSISETITVPIQSSRTLRTRRLTSKSVPRRLRSTRREFTSFSRQSDSDRDLKNGDDEDDNDNNDDDGNGSESSKIRRFVRLPKPSVSRMIADKILTKSIARTPVATDALKRIKESSSTGGRRRLGEDDDGDNYDKDENNYVDDNNDGGYNNDDDDDIDDTDKEKGRIHARKSIASHTSDKKMDMIISSSSSRKSERKRQGLREKEVEPTTKKRSRDIDDTKKLYKVGSVVAVYEDTTRKGKWTPAVVVAEVPFKAATKGNVNIGKNDVPGWNSSSHIFAAYYQLTGEFYFRWLEFSLIRNIRGDHAHFAESSPKAAMDRAKSFRQDGKDHKFMMMMHDPRNANTDLLRLIKKVSGKAKREIEKKTSAESSTSESDNTSDEEYGEERDQFTAQLYKFHEERGTPINRAPILGGKDIDMFRLYNMVQRYGGKKRVTENNQWKLILRKMHLEGCPGATSVTVKNAYSRYLDHFNSFYRNLGISSWLSTPTPSTSSRSERPNPATKKMGVGSNKEKEKGQKESAIKGKITKREKDDIMPRTKREKIKKDERNVTKSDVSEDDDKTKGVPSTSSQSPTSLLCLSPDSKIKSKTKDEEEQDKESVSDSGTIESTKEKELLRLRRNHSKDEQQLDLKTFDVDKRAKVLKKSSSEGYTKRKSPSIVSTTSNVDQGVSGSDDEAHIRQMRLKEARKLATTGAHFSVDQKELSAGKRDGNIIGKDSDIAQVLRKEKTKEGVPWFNCSPATVLTNFYMGQNVKAYHHGQWYDARVITVGKISHGDVLSSMMDFEARCKAINESIECDEKERKEALTKASARLNDRLEGILREMTCCVHYLGWNSRYDEWVELIKIKVHEKDQKLSEEQFLSIASDKLSAPTLEAAVAWRSSVDPSKLLATEVCSSGMRPRRLSHTHEHIIHPEKVSLTTTDSTVLKAPDDSLKQNAVNLTSANFLTESDAEIILKRLPEEASVSETSPHSFISELISTTVFLSGGIDEKKLPEANSNFKRRRTVSDNHSSAADLLEHSTNAPVIISVESTSESDLQKVAVTLTGAEADHVLALDEVNGTKQIDAGDIVKSGNDEQSFSEVAVGSDDNSFNRATVFAEEKEQHADESERQAKLMILTKSSEMDLNEYVDAKQKELLKCSIFVRLSPAEDLIQKVAPSCKEVSLESEAVTEDIVSKECDDEVWHPPMSLGLKQRGRGMKKKKIGRNASNTLAERKGMGKGGFKQINSEERSKESEECSSSDDESLPNVRDSWHALKVRMQQKVELEGAMLYAEKELNLEPIDIVGVITDEDLTGEALVNSYQERMQELRDIYHSIRIDQARLDRRWRKTLEKEEKDELFVQSPISDNVVQ